ncbi:UNVERIFIED_CONTAM: hypothetical protein FKN15_035578 [Acipenser sinensis]
MMMDVSCVKSRMFYVLPDDGSLRLLVLSGSFGWGGNSTTQVSICLECNSSKLRGLKRKWIRCSAQATVLHLKKFIAKKLNLASFNELDILCNEEILGKDHTLKFVVVTRWRFKVSICLECNSSKLGGLKRKWIRCSAQATVLHLKKFIAKKLNLASFNERVWLVSNFLPVPTPKNNLYSSNPQGLDTRATCSEKRKDMVGGTAFTSLTH